METKPSKKLSCALESITGSLPNDEFLTRLLELMAKEDVFIKLFGEKLKNVNIHKPENLTSARTPYLRLRQLSSTFQSHDTINSSKFEGVLFLSPTFIGNYEVKKRLGSLFWRYFSSDPFSEIFDLVAGLESIDNLRFDFSSTYKVGAGSYPAIIMTFDTKVDLYKWKHAHPEIDFKEPLTGNEFDLQTVFLVTENAENSDVLIKKEKIWEIADHGQ